MLGNDLHGISKPWRAHVLLKLFQVNQPILQPRVSVRKADFASQHPAMKLSEVWCILSRIVTNERLEAKLYSWPISYSSKIAHGP